MGCWCHEAVCRFGHAFPIFIFWNDCLDFTRFSRQTWRVGTARFGNGLHVSPRLIPSKGAKLCTYFAWFFCPSQLRFEPYLDIPVPISRSRLMVQFRIGSLPCLLSKAGLQGQWSPAVAPVHVVQYTCDSR